MELELAQRFARAYREIDEDAMRAVLAPSARIRVLMPRGIVEHEGPAPLIAALRELAAKWAFEDADQLTVDVLSENLLQTGRLVFLGQRVHLRSADGGRTATMATKHLLAVKEGRIVLVDELCSGVMPAR